MNEFPNRITCTLEVATVNVTDGFKAVPQWVPLSALSVLAMLDAGHRVNLPAADFGPVKTIGDLWDLVPSRKDL